MLLQKNKKMKKTGLILLALVGALNTGLAQNVDDALRYSQLFYNGSARFMSMGGAFTAIGGDISSLSQNPAGIGVFRTSELTISPQLFNFRSTTGFNNNTNSDYLYDFTLGQAGVVLNLRNKNKETGMITLNLGYSFNRTNNFNQSIEIQGTGNNNSTSLLDYWAKISDGIPAVDSILARRVPDAFLAWSTWLLDTLPGSTDSYGTVYSNYGKDYPSVYGQEVTRLISTTGYTGEHAISIGGNYSNKLFFGVTLAITKVLYESKFEHSEKTSEVFPSQFTDFNYTYFYRNTGTGYSLKLGAIYKPIEPLRIGFSFHSPTLFRISEYVYDNMYTHINGDDASNSNNTMWYKYALTTPFRATLGAAYQIKKFAVLSAEYEFIDYGMTKFSDTGDDWDYSKDNQEIKDILKSSSNIRAGAEVRLNRLYFRGGYSYYGKAYRAGDINENIDYNAISFGAGFREQNVYVDFGFTRMSNQQNYILYSYFDDIQDKLITSSSDININRNSFTVSFGYKFGY
jgi:hypothetical protein